MNLKLELDGLRSSLSEKERWLIEVCAGFAGDWLVVGIVVV